MHERMQWYVDQEILSCCLTLVMRGTDVVDFETFGYMDVEDKRPLTADAIFRMYSNTKIVTSVAAMMLFERGSFALDDPLSNYLPAFAEPAVLRSNATSVAEVEPLAAPITLRQVMSHSAGFSYGFIEPESLIDQAYMTAGINPLVNDSLTLEALCDLLALQPLAYQPGTSWRYSFATDVLARVIEVISGQRFDAFLAEHIFEPLGMVDTGFFVPEDKRDRFTTMYAPTDLLAPMKGAGQGGRSADRSVYVGASVSVRRWRSGIHGRRLPDVSAHDRQRRRVAGSAPAAAGNPDADADQSATSRGYGTVPHVGNDRHRVRARFRTQTGARRR